MSNAGGAPGASTSASGEYRPGVDSMPLFRRTSCTRSRVARRRATRTTAGACCWLAAANFPASSMPSHRAQRSTSQRGCAVSAATCPTGSASREGGGGGARFSDRRRSTAFAYPAARARPSARTSSTPWSTAARAGTRGWCSSSKADTRSAARTGASSSAGGRAPCAASARSSSSCQRSAPYVSSVQSAASRGSIAPADRRAPSSARLAKAPPCSTRKSTSAASLRAVETATRGLLQPQVRLRPPAPTARVPAMKTLHRSRLWVPRGRRRAAR